MALLLLSGCGTKKIAGDGTGQTIEMKPDRKGIATLGKSQVSTNKTMLSNVEIAGNKLIVTVSYSGGCKEHQFDLVGDEAISKSLPPQRSIRIVHTGEPDLCKAMLIKTLEFDISNLAYKKEKGSEIMLNLEGWDTPLKYVYP